MSETPEQVAERTEFVNRAMDRLMATARYGRQPGAQSPATEIIVRGDGGREVSVAIRESDIVAILHEVTAHLPCGVCGQDPCAWRKPEDDA